MSAPRKQTLEENLYLMLKDGEYSVTDGIELLGEGMRTFPCGDDFEEACKELFRRTYGCPP